MWIFSFGMNDQRLKEQARGSGKLTSVGGWVHLPSTKRQPTARSRSLRPCTRYAGPRRSPRALGGRARWITVGNGSASTLAINGSDSGNGATLSLQRAVAYALEEED
jgi:hypothetical protein